MGNSNHHQLSQQKKQDILHELKKHYEQVNALRHVISDHDQLVDEISDIVSESANEEDNNMKRKVDKLKEMQLALNQQYMVLFDSTKDLFKRINDILKGDDISKNQENSHENMNNTQMQSVRSNADGQNQNGSQQTNTSTVHSSENNDLKEQVSKLKRIIEQLKSRNEYLEEENSKLRPPKGMGTVQLFHSHGGNTIKEIEEDLKEMLKSHKVKLIKCNRLDDIKPSKSLIILSIITSKAGTDATNAIKDIKNPASTVLVLIHIKDDHALPRHTSSSILTGEIFQALGGIFDMAFMPGKGIYHCEMNETALEGMDSFIKQNLEGTSL